MDRLRRPLNAPDFRGAKPRRHSRPTEGGMLIERDLQVPTRFGFDLLVPVVRLPDEN